MTNPTPLSPAAQAIVNAAIADDYGRPTSVLYRRLAAALRAVADQLTFEDSLAGAVINPRELLDIATELEALPDD